ncbi:receptor-like kinase LIP1 [Papaver somniferum]|uniref:receptor-like kinase LIP1 n=1 Tax=Papaver somniferum TaxID=3469 RepID=UPI000E6FB607|nr:receptor-like kinase LIP1 [Papaver somniferum]
MKVTEKCDVYSFGVVILEVLMGGHPSELITLISQILLQSSSASNLGQNTKLRDILDQCIGTPPDVVQKEIMCIVKVGFSCLRGDPLTRPTMEEISAQLSSSTQSITSLPKSFETITLTNLLTKNSSSCNIRITFINPISSSSFKDDESRKRKPSYNKADTESEIDGEKKKKVKRVLKSLTINTSIVMTEFNYKEKHTEVSPNVNINAPSQCFAASASFNVSASSREISAPTEAALVDHSVVSSSKNVTAPIVDSTISTFVNDRGSLRFHDSRRRLVQAEGFSESSNTIQEVHRQNAKLKAALQGESLTSENLRSKTIQELKDEDSEILDLKSFERKVHVLTEIRHRNIVKLFGFCSNIERRISFLVYEFVEREA